MDFDALYAKYPRHEGKKRGMAICRRKITSRRLYQQLDSAIVAYAERMRRERRDKEYIKQFDTFMGCWEDFIPDAAKGPEQAALFTAANGTQPAAEPRIDPSRMTGLEYLLGPDPFGRDA